MRITKSVAQKVLTIVDAGLVSGLGQPVPGQMCVEAAVCFALDLPHGDDPGCVTPALRSLKIALNDSSWSNNQARANGLRRLAIAQLGSKDVLDEKEFVRRVVELTISKTVAGALETAASLHPQLEHKEALMAAAKRCREEKSQAAADAANAADAAADAAAYAAADAAAYAARAAAYAARAAARAAAYAAYAARAAARAAAYAAGAARDKELAIFAEDVVQILIAMKAPGCKWLSLTEVTQ